MHEELEHAMELQDRMEVALEDLRVLAALLDPEQPLPLKDRERLGMMLARHLYIIEAGIVALHTTSEKE